MPVKIRLQRKGRRKRPFYHIVIADSRAPRDGRFIEKIGTYNPMTNPATIDLDRDAAFEWMGKGAQPTDTVRAILRFKGVMYRKHLQRGVSKGALTQEDADQKYQEWIDAKEGKVADRATASKQEKAARIAKIAGVAPPPPAPVVEEVVEEAAPEAVTPAEDAPAPADPVAVEAAEAAPAEAAEIASEAVAEVEAAKEVTEALAENPQGAEDVAPEAEADEKKEA